MRVHFAENSLKQWSNEANWCGRETYTVQQCHFLDSINITDGTVQLDNNIIVRGTRFAKINSRINSVIDNGMNQVPVESYLRDIKPYIRRIFR